MIPSTTKSLLLILLLSPLFSQAQEYLNKGNYMVGGRFNIAVSETDVANPNNVQSIIDQSGFSISPYIGKFIKDKTLAE